MSRRDKSQIEGTRGRGGRPSRLRAAQLKDRILDAAEDLFFTEGYGAASIEAVAKQAGISKRTFYHRFEDKADLFRAVMHRVVERLRPQTNGEGFSRDGAIADRLAYIARNMLQAALRPDALALNRLILAEAARFPEIARAVHEQGARRHAIENITALLEIEIAAGRLRMTNPAFAAEQFLHMAVAAPQRRAMGLGKPMNRRELDDWAQETVALFLNGCR